MGSCYELHRSVLEARDLMKPLEMKIIENQWKPLDINENNDQSMKIVPWSGDACATGGVRQHRETIRNLKGGVKEGVGAQIGSQGGMGVTTLHAIGYTVVILQLQVSCILAPRVQATLVVSTRSTARGVGGYIYIYIYIDFFIYLFMYIYV